MKGFLKIATYRGLGAGLVLIPVITLWLWPSVGLAQASVGLAQECLAGFDFGSSGVRVALNEKGTAKVPKDAPTYLDLVKTFDDSLVNRADSDIKSALSEATNKKKEPPVCKLVGGGASAWRLALAEHGGEALAVLLKKIQGKSGVPVLVVPAKIEGWYAYRATIHALRYQGIALETEFVWDVGGGSMQIGSDDKEAGWGSVLGQQVWRDKFCMEIKGEGEKCDPNPVGVDAKSESYDVLEEFVDGASDELGDSDLEVVTAVSKPFQGTLYPILKCVAEIESSSGTVDDKGFKFAALSHTIDILHDKTTSEILGIMKKAHSDPRICEEAAGIEEKHIMTAVTDMLLVYTFMDYLSIDEVNVILGVEINNAQGILEDERAFAWADNYDCYLRILAEDEVQDIYGKDPRDPATCSEE